MFCLVALLAQQPTVESLGIPLVLAATTGHAGKGLASATQSKRTALVVFWTVVFLVYYGRVLAFFIKYAIHHQLKRDQHLPPPIFFPPSVVIYPTSIELKM